MKQYLESALLQRKVSEYWALNRPVAAICHGTLLLSRCKDSSTGNSLLYHRKTTTLPKYMENAGAALAGARYHTYDVHCEDEVRSFLERDAKQCELGNGLFGKGGPYQQGGAFVCEDGNYISARWPGDAFWFGRRLLEKLYEEVEAETENQVTAEPLSTSSSSSSAAPVDIPTQTEVKQPETAVTASLTTESTNTTSQVAAEEEAKEEEKPQEEEPSKEEEEKPSEEEIPQEEEESRSHFEEQQIKADPVSA
jgi:putative intracellular protease/amidase